MATFILQEKKECWLMQVQKKSHNTLFSYVCASIYLSVNFIFLWIVEPTTQTVLAMPALSPTMVGNWTSILSKNFGLPARSHNFMFVGLLQSHGNIAKWMKKEGDKVGHFLFLIDKTSVNLYDVI